MASENEMKYSLKPRAALFASHVLLWMALCSLVLFTVNDFHDKEDTTISGLLYALCVTVALPNLVSNFLLDMILHGFSITVLLWLMMELVDVHNTQIKLFFSWFCVASSMFLRLHHQHTQAIPQKIPPTAEFTCNLYSYWSFSFLTEFINACQTKTSLEMTDIPILSDCDTCQLLHDKLQVNTASGTYDHLGWQVFRIIRADFLIQGACQFLISITTYMVPLAVQRILMYIATFEASHEEAATTATATTSAFSVHPFAYASRHFSDHILPHAAAAPSTSSSSSPLMSMISVNAAVVMLFVIPIVQAITSGVSFNLSKRVWFVVRSLFVTVLYKKVTVVDLSALGDRGSVTNLISVDVKEISESLTYTHYVWSCALEIGMSLYLLYTILGVSMFGGLAVLLLSFPTGAFLTVRLRNYQKQLMKIKDERMAVITEVLSGIRLIKWFAWEDNFREKVDEVRKKELNSLYSVVVTTAFVRTNFGFVPVFVGLVTFLVRTKLLGLPLAASEGFTSMLLFNLLRRPMKIFPDIVAMLTRGYVSFQRIKKFLNTPNIDGFRSSENRAEQNPGFNNKEPALSFNNVTLAWADPKSDKDEVKKEKSGVLSKLVSKVKEVATKKKDVATKGDYQQVNGGATNDNGNALSQLDDENSDDVHNPVNFSINIHDDDDDESNHNADADLVDATVAASDLKDESEITYTTALKHVSLSIPKGSLTAIVGSTGSGKSTLIAGLLGECKLAAGSVTLAPNTNLSLVTQSAWIQNASLRENILFGAKYDAERYQQVIRACALDVDLRQLPHGDQTDIGEKGINLSGGQQQRVSLARAAYSQSNFIILDDPLSAVDAHVGDHIFKELICGFLKDRTRLLVTHQAALVIPQADLVICMSGQRGVAACCPPSQLSIQLKQFIEESNGHVALTKAKNIGFLELMAAISSGSMDELAPEMQEQLAVISRQTSAESKKDVEFEEEEEKEHLAKEVVLLVNKEEKSAGAVSWKVYWFYVNAAGGYVTAIAALLSNVALVTTWFMSNYFLGHWMTSMELNESSSKQNFYLAAYVSVAIVFSCFVAFMYLFEAFQALKAARSIHDNMFNSILTATLTWHDSQPSGRKINRFSQDISTVDSNIMNNLQDFFDCLLSTTQIVLIISTLIPVMIPFFLPIIVYNYWVSSKYIRAARELKRLDSVAKSPIFVLFAETMTGLPIIRSFQHQKRFFELCCQYTDKANRAHFYLWLVTRWYNFRTQFLGALVTGTVAFGVVHYASTLGNTTAGLILIYAMNFTDNLTWTTRTYGDCEMNMNSVERIMEYTKVESEIYEPIGNVNNNKSALTNGEKKKGKDVEMVEQASFQRWPQRGSVLFSHIELKYRPTDPPVLKDVSFNIPPGHKVGVCGRSGAGKSSLVAALFRTVEPTAGELIIGDRNVLKMPLKQLRKALAIVPQEPVLFRGSIKSNLDPFSQWSDGQIWSALEKVHMADHVSRMPGAVMVGGPLDLILIADQGSNLSVGQRQLLCMARALLSDAKILVLDEATASVDAETDALIQETVRNEMKNLTVISIAHRLHTIAYYDKVIVMDAGRVAEYDTPLNLLNNTSSIFYSMCERSGDLNNILSIAKLK